MVDEVKVPSARILRTAWNVCFFPGRVAENIKLNDELSFDRAMRFGGYCVFLLASAPLLTPIATHDGSKLEKLITPYIGIISSIVIVLLMFPVLVLAIGKRVDGNRIGFGNYLHVAAYTLVFHVFDAVASAASLAVTSERADPLQSAFSALLMIWAALVLAQLLNAKTHAGYLRIGGAMIPILAVVLYAIALPPPR